MRAWWLLLLGTSVLACRSSGGAGSEDETSGRPSPYADDEDVDAEPPTLTPDQAAAAAMAGLRAFVGLEPDAAVAAFEAMLVLEDGCPEEQATLMEGDVTVVTWSTEGCTTSAGLEIRGSGRFERHTTTAGDATSEGATVSSEGTTLRLHAADGRMLELSGYLGYERASSPEGAESYFEVSGQLAADPETAATSPLLDAAMRPQGGLFSYSDGTYAVLGGQGSLGAAALPDGLAFQLSDVLVAPPECDLEPLGTLSVRDDAGYWHDIVFDAGTFDASADEDPVFDPSRCDGCGAYLVGGDLRGEVCVDRADVLALMDWEGTPW